MIQLGRKLGVNGRDAPRRTVTGTRMQKTPSRFGFSVLVPVDRDMPLMLGFAFGAD